MAHWLVIKSLAKSIGTGRSHAGICPVGCASLKLIPKGVELVDLEEYITQPTLRVQKSSPKYPAEALRNLLHHSLVSPLPFQTIPRGDYLLDFHSPTQTNGLLVPLPQLIIAATMHIRGFFLAALASTATARVLIPRSSPLSFPFLPSNLLQPTMPPQNNSPTNTQFLIAKLRQQSTMAASSMLKKNASGLVLRRTVRGVARMGIEKPELTLMGMALTAGPGGRVFVARLGVRGCSLDLERVPR